MLRKHTLASPAANRHAVKQNSAEKNGCRRDCIPATSANFLRGMLEASFPLPNRTEKRVRSHSRLSNLLDRDVRPQFHYEHPKLFPQLRQT